MSFLILKTFTNVPKSLIIGATLYKALENPLSTIDFDYLIVDEASQLNVALGLACLYLGKKVLFVGNHKQMPPLIKGDYKDLWLNQSIFEFLFGKCESITLDTTYRTNKKLAEFPSQEFYEGLLKPCNTKTETFLTYKRSPIKHFEILNGKNPLTLLTYKSTSKYLVQNEKEANIIKELVEEMLSCGVRSADIAIISPYRSQCRVISALLNTPDLTIETIEKIQGQER